MGKAEHQPAGMARATGSLPGRAALAQERLGQPPSKLAIAQLDASFLAAFLDNLEINRDTDVRSRNARLAALRSFYRYVALEVPQLDPHPQLE